MNIVFTGGCHSGKTTSIELIKDIYENQGRDVIVFSEPIRTLDVASIDDLRADPNAYIEIQDKYTRARIDLEKTLMDYKDSDKDVIRLIDRSVSDTLFYSMFYTNINGADTEHKKMLTSLIDDTLDHLCNKGRMYDYIFEFAPIRDVKEKDHFRPDDLSVLQNTEYHMIHLINDTFYNEHPGYMHFNLNRTKLDDLRAKWGKFVNITLRGKESLKNQ